MKLLAIILLALLTATGVALLIARDPGYVQIIYDQWTLQTSLAVLVLAMLLVFFALHYSIRLLGAMRRFPHRLKKLQHQKYLNRARTALAQGLLKLAEGEWAAAERQLTRHIEHSETPLLNYLAAAQAAHRQHAIERRDNYLQRARQYASGNDLAIGLTQATLQLDQGEKTPAIATLASLRDTAPQNTAVLKQLMTLYHDGQDWEHLLDLLPGLRRTAILTPAQTDELECASHAGLLAKAAQSKDSLLLVKTWQQVPQKLRTNEDILHQYTLGLIAQGAGQQAEALLGDAIQKTWSGKLVRIYGLATGADPAKQLTRAESWLKDHDNDPALLQTLGRLCLRNRLWGKAQRYLEASIASGAQPETYHLLGQLLERLGEQEHALECYRKGLMMTTDPTLPTPPLPTHPSAQTRESKRIERAKPLA